MVITAITYFRTANIYLVTTLCGEFYITINAKELADQYGVVIKVIK